MNRRYALRMEVMNKWLGIYHASQATSRSEEKSLLSIHAIRWKWAIRRVILSNRVQLSTLFWHKWMERKELRKQLVEVSSLQTAVLNLVKNTSRIQYLNLCSRVDKSKLAFTQLFDNMGDPFLQQKLNRKKRKIRELNENICASKIQRFFHKIVNGKSLYRTIVNNSYKEKFSAYHETCVKRIQETWATHQSRRRLKKAIGLVTSLASLAR